MTFHKHRRLFALSILLAFLAAAVLPAEACVAAAATAQPGCPDCTSPCCDPDRCCCATVAAACAASMLPATITPSQSLGKAAPAAAFPVTFPQHSAASSGAAAAPPVRPPAYLSPSSLNLRFCRFQE